MCLALSRISWILAAIDFPLLAEEGVANAELEAVPLSEPSGIANL